MQQEEDNILKNAVLLVDGNKGIYVPNWFADQYRLQIKNVSKEDLDILIEGPDEEYYWETWETVETNGVLTLDGKDYSLYQDGDLWAIPIEQEITLSESEINARRVVLYYHIYRLYLQDNGLDNDSNSITVDSLIDFVEDQIDEEQREEYAKKVNIEI